MQHAWGIISASVCFESSANITHLPQCSTNISRQLQTDRRRTVMPNLATNLASNLATVLASRKQHLRGVGNEYLYGTENSANHIDSITIEVRTLNSTRPLEAFERSRLLFFYTRGSSERLVIRYSFASKRTPSFSAFLTHGNRGFFVSSFLFLVLNIRLQE